MTSPALPSAKRMRLRYAGMCRRCGQALRAGQWASYIRATRQVSCLTCAYRPESTPAGAARNVTDRSSHAGTSDISIVSIQPPVDSGVAGASARREHERRSALHEQQVRAAHLRIGGLILAVTDEPQHIQSWARGAPGEEKLGAGLDRLAGRGVRLLHDRRIRGSRANIDHIAISPAGVFVIDAKRYRGRPELHVQGGLLRPRVESLRVGRRDRTTLVDGAVKQVDLVQAALTSSQMIGGGVPVRGMLCFIDAEWPLIGGSFRINGIDVLWPKKAYELICTAPTLTPDRVNELHRLLASAFPIA